METIYTGHPECKPIQVCTCRSTPTLVYLGIRDKSQNYRIVEVGRDLWRSSGSTPLLKQGHNHRITEL